VTPTQLGTAIVLLAAVVGALGFLLTKAWRAVRWVVRAVRLSVRAFEDIVGTPEHPGVIDRLQLVEVTQGEHGALLRSMHYELHPNGGMSMRDSVTRLERAVGTHPLTKETP
jgi:hypothetical protein